MLNGWEKNGRDSDVLLRGLVSRSRRSNDVEFPEVPVTKTAGANSVPELKLTKTVEIVARSFSRAENEVRKIIAETRPDADEEEITLVLQGELAKYLKIASDIRHIENAFVQDCSRAFPTGNLKALQTAASGLIAEVSWQNRSTESRTGGDFGIVLARPVVTRGFDALRIETGNRRGLLIQAKKRHTDGQWGRLTRNQERLFQTFRSHGALLLYRFADARTLTAFQWNVCRSRQLSTVKNWMLEDAFPKGMSSSELITDLGRGTVGTDDPCIVGTNIAPANQRTLMIRIHWRGDQPPKSQVLVNLSPIQRHEQLHMRAH